MSPEREHWRRQARLIGTRSRDHSDSDHRTRNLLCSATIPSILKLPPLPSDIRGAADPELGLVQLDTRLGMHVSGLCSTDGEAPPTATFSGPITVMVTDSNLATANKTYTLTIQPSVSLVCTPPALSFTYTIGGRCRPTSRALWSPRPVD
jgi:hypothetical protein